MKLYRMFFISILVLFSSAYAVESETAKVNSKYDFIKEIYDDSWAIIIGINKYQNVDPLHFAVNDAKIVKEMLIEKYGFAAKNIKYLINNQATKENILDAIDEIVNNAKERDRVVVFYAGHGDTYKLPSGGEMGYLIPVDGFVSKEKIFRSSIAMSRIEEMAKMSAAKHILYLIDACYGGLSVTKRGLTKEQTPEYLLKRTKEKGRQIITAGGKDEQVIEKGEWAHSAFTRNLIKGLDKELADQNYDGVITGEELGIFIRDRVVVDSDGAHTPQNSRIGSEMGEFVFISQTLAEEEVASIQDEHLDGIEAQLKTQQEQIAQLLELQKRQGEHGKKEAQPQAIHPVVKPKQAPSMKIASTLAWVFPGMGHYYLGSSGKGLLFTSLELLSLVGTMDAAIQFNDNFADFQTKNNFLNDPNRKESCPEGSSLTTCSSQWLDDANQAELKYKKSSVQLTGMGIISAGIWIWNIKDIKKGRRNISDTSGLSGGIDRSGRISIHYRLKF